MPRTALAISAALLLAAGHAAVSAGEIYRPDFSRADGLEGYWSSADRSRTPKTREDFLGEFRNERVSLTLQGLPRHRYLKVSFDLYLIRNWPGDGGSGPSVWRCALATGPELVHASFSVWPDFPETQSFPALFPLARTKALTGASGKNTLGYTASSPGHDWGGRDAVYRMSFVVPHRGAAARFDFSARGLSDEKPPTERGAWGLDNVIVLALEARPVVKLSEEQMQSAWDSLGDADPVRIDGAVRSLVDAGDQAVAFLKGKTPGKLTKERVEELLRQLDSDDFATREAASGHLAEAGASVRARLEAALKADPSPEARQRLLRALEDTGPGGRAARRHGHLRYVLALIGTDEAVRLWARLGEE
jgi:hypothetical protein